MRFMSKQPRLKIVIRPAVKQHQPGSGQVTLIDRGLRARFRDHFFDSEIAQKQLGWTDEERMLVEEQLLANHRYGKANGFYLEDIAERRAAQLDKKKDRSNEQIRCLEFYRDPETNEAVQCPNAVVPDTEFCADHQPVSEETDDEVMAGMAAAVASVPSAE